MLNVVNNSHDAFVYLTSQKAHYFVRLFPRFPYPVFKLVMEVSPTSLEKRFSPELV